MKSQQSKRRRRQRRPTGSSGRHGFDPIRQGSARFAGAIPIGNKGVDGTRLLFFAGYHEAVAGLIALLHPLIAKIGRGDMSDAAARLRHATGPSGPRINIQALHDGTVVGYQPDYDARTHDGAQVIIEAGKVRQKATSLQLAKLAAARSVAAQSGGQVWVIDAARVPSYWIHNARLLYLRSLDRPQPDIEKAVRAIWECGRASIRDVVERLSNQFEQHDPAAIEAAAFKVAGDLLAEGRLDVRLDRHLFSLSTPVRTVPAGRPLVLPPGIIGDLDELRRLADSLGGPLDVADESEDGADDAAALSIDPDSITDPVARDEFLRRRQAMWGYLANSGNAARVARDHGISTRRMQQLVVAYHVHGELALLPYGTQIGPRGSRLPAAMVRKIVELFVGSERLTVAAIVEHPKIRELTAKLGLPRSPGPAAVRAVTDRAMASQQSVRQARAGKALVPASMFGRSIPTWGGPAVVCEVDEAWLDVTGIALDGTKTPIRLHVGVLLCIATRMPLAVVISPKVLDQWDYRRLLLRAILPKDHLQRQFRYKNDWPSAMPYVVRADRGKIETSNLVFQAAADLPIIVEFAPVRDAHGKPFVESFIGVMKRRFEHRLKITTKSSPAHRGAHRPEAAAIAGNITVDEIEMAIMRFLIDVYARQWHSGLRQRPCTVWDDRLGDFGIRRWLRSADELRSLLKRDEGLRLVTRKGVSYKGRWYGKKVLEHVQGTTVRIKVDEDDLRSIDVYDEAGVSLCVATNEELEDWHRPVSRWELLVADEINKTSKASANAEALANNDEIVRDLTKNDQAKRVRRHRYQAKRADEAMTELTRDALALAQGSTPDKPKRIPVAPPMQRPVANDSADYIPLPMELEEESDDHAA